MKTSIGIVASTLAVAAGAACGGPLMLQNATATYSQEQFFGPWDISETINGDFNTGAEGWAIFDRSGTTTAQTAAFEFASDVSVPAVQLDFHQLHNNPGHMIGAFRISFTTDDRDTFADGLGIGGDVDANWTVATPLSVVLPGGVTWSVRPDGAILVGGTNPGTGVYTVTYALPTSGITGLRLEVLEDDSLPIGGPGRFASNGNFVLTELTATAVPTPGAAALLGLGGLLGARRRR